MSTNSVPFETKERAYLETDTLYLLDTFKLPLISAGYKICRDYGSEVILAQFRSLEGRSFGFTRAQVGVMAERIKYLPAPNSG